MTKESSFRPSRVANCGNINFGVGVNWTSLHFPPKPGALASGCATRREKHLFLTCTKSPHSLSEAVGVGFA